MPCPVRYAACNELFDKVPFSEALSQLRRLGYQGVEIAPFTLQAYSANDNPLSLSQEQRSDIRRALASEGLAFVGLHWLLVGPPGLHVTTRVESVRSRSWDYVAGLIDLCADLADAASPASGVMVFGSPKQRSAVDGMSAKEAVDVFTGELARLAPHAESRGVTILIEALPANQSDVINSIAEAVAIVKQIGSPAIQTMFDSHNAVDEKEEHASLIRRYRAYIRHVHVNEIDGREPGMGDYDFAEIMAALKDIDYRGWVSLEAFDFSRDPVEIAGRAINHLKTADAAALNIADAGMPGTPDSVRVP